MSPYPLLCGVGKSENIKSMFRHAVDSRVPVFLCDPHGDLYWDFLRYADARRRAEDVIDDHHTAEGGSS